MVQRRLILHLKEKERRKESRRFESWGSQVRSCRRRLCPEGQAWLKKR